MKSILFPLFLFPLLVTLNPKFEHRNPSLETRNSAPLHAIYISYTDVKYKEADGLLTAQVRMFSNDLEDALRGIGAPAEPGLEEGETPHADIDAFICTYLGNEFQVWANGQPVNLSYMGKKREEDATWISLQAEDLCELNQLRVHNSVLFELFDDQTNILRVRAYGKLKNYNLTKRIPDERISW